MDSVKKQEKTHNKPILTIKKLKKCFGDKEVLCGLDLEVPEHSVFGFIGRNGAGKTTTMKAVLGLLKPDAGEIFISGERVVYGQTPTNRYIGYLPDVPEFYSYMTPLEYLYLCGECSNMKKTDIRTRSAELLELVGLGEEKRRIKGFSRGMKQRLGIAQALLNRPRFLICDEPTSALDPVGRKEILDILLAVREQTTVLFSTHILSDVERICTDAAFINDGRIALQGNVTEIKNVRSEEGFAVEVIKEEDRKKLQKAFGNFRRMEGNFRRMEGNVLLFKGTEEELFTLLRFAADEKILLEKLERIEPTLESLFLEVAEK